MRILVGQEPPRKGGRMYECFHCGERAVIWDSDFSYEDMGLIGEGFVHVCHCSNCGAEIIYYIKGDEDDD